MVVEYTYSSCIFAQNSKCKIYTRITLQTFFFQKKISFLHLYLSENFHSCSNSLLQLGLSKCALKVPGFLEALYMSRVTSLLGFLAETMPYSIHFSSDNNRRCWQQRKCAFLLASFWFQVLTALRGRVGIVVISLLMVPLQLQGKM